MPTKKTTTKKVTKTAVKKTAKRSTGAKAPKKTKKPAQVRALVCAIDEECFWTRDGSILRDMKDLHVVVSSMDEEIFFHHVNKEKNDFADWVEYVLQDKACADALRKAKKQETLNKTVERHLRNYTQ